MKDRCKSDALRSRSGWGLNPKKKKKKKLQVKEGLKAAGQGNQTNSNWVAVSEGTNGKRELERTQKRLTGASAVPPVYGRAEDTLGPHLTGPQGPTGPRPWPHSPAYAHQAQRPVLVLLEGLVFYLQLILSTPLHLLDLPVTTLSTPAPLLPLQNQRRKSSPDLF